MKLAKLLHVLLLLLALALFLWGAERQAGQVNTDMNRMDQDAYRDYAKKLAETDNQYVGDRNRMPIYPWLLARFYRAGMTDEQFFAVAKQVNIGLTVLVLAGAYLIFYAYTSLVVATTAILVAAFTMFVYKAPFFQAEVLYYGFSFVLFVLMLELLWRPHWGLAVGTGVVGALAQLTKASVLPAIGLGLACLLLRAVVAFFEQRAAQQRTGEQTAKKLGAPAWSMIVRPVACGLLALVVFLAVLFPYIQVSKARFGQYFYNVNSTFYMWYDSWDEVKQGTRAHGDRVGWPDMPTDQLPSLGKYLREHTAGQILERFSQGLLIIRDMTFASYGYAPFLVGYLLLALILVGQNWRQLKAHWWQAKTAVIVLFVAAYFVGYLLLYAWYLRIAYGNRFVLALFLPALFTFAWVLGYAQRHSLAFSLGRWRLPATWASYGIALMLAGYLLLVFPEQIATMFGGF